MELRRFAEQDEKANRKKEYAAAEKIYTQNIEAIYEPNERAGKLQEWINSINVKFPKPPAYIKYRLEWYGKKLAELEEKGETGMYTDVHGQWGQFSGLKARKNIGVDVPKIIDVLSIHDTTYGSHSSEFVLNGIPKGEIYNYELAHLAWKFITSPEGAEKLLELMEEKNRMIFADCGLADNGYGFTEPQREIIRNRLKNVKEVRPFDAFKRNVSGGGLFGGKFVPSQSGGRRIEIDTANGTGIDFSNLAHETAHAAQDEKMFATSLGIFIDVMVGSLIETPEKKKAGSFLAEWYAGYFNSSRSTERESVRRRMLEMPPKKREKCVGMMIKSVFGFATKDEMRQAFEIAREAMEKYPPIIEKERQEIFKKALK